MLLQPLQCALGLSPLPARVEKDSAANDPFSQRVCGGALRDSARGACWPCLPHVCPCTVSLSVSGLAPSLPPLPLPAVVSCRFNEENGLLRGAAQQQCI